MKWRTVICSVVAACFRVEHVCFRFPLTALQCIMHNPDSVGFRTSYKVFCINHRLKSWHANSYVRYFLRKGKRWLVAQPKMKVEVDINFTAQEYEWRERCDSYFNSSRSLSVTSYLSFVCSIRLWLNLYGRRRSWRRTAFAKYGTLYQSQNPFIALR